MSHSTELKASGIFVDLENMALAGDQQRVRFDLVPIMVRVDQVSIPILRKAYGDWGQFAKYKQDFIDRAFDLVQYFSGTWGKNGVDIQLSIDALEAIFHFPHLATVFLVTGDSDYCPLIRMLRKYGRRVIGIGWLKSTGKVFHEHCDEFWSYDEMAGLLANQQKLVDSESLKPLIRQVCVDLGPGKWVEMSRLKNVMLHHDPTFDEKRYGFTKFSEFVAAHPDLQAKYSEESSNYLVQLPRDTSVYRNGKH